MSVKGKAELVKMSGKESSDELIQAADGDDLDVGTDLGGVGLRHGDLGEAERGSLAGPEIGLGDAADLAQQADLAEEGQIVR